MLFFCSVVYVLVQESLVGIIDCRATVGLTGDFYDNLNIPEYQFYFVTEQNLPPSLSVCLSSSTNEHMWGFGEVFL